MLKVEQLNLNQLPGLSVESAAALLKLAKVQPSLTQISLKDSLISGTLVEKIM